jgi:pimeloyl-ACP methyl ester carboxylesterase
MKLRNILTPVVVAGGVLGTMAVLNKLTETQAGELNTVLLGEERRYPWKYGDVFYEVKGEREAKPLVLVHGFGPGASSYEWRKNIDILAAQYRVYVLDLLGFGLSDRPAIDYTAETFSDLIGDFVKEVIGKPATVVAHGLTSAYVVAEAYRRPKYFERLVLVSPPISILEDNAPGFVGTALKTALRLPLIGEFIYNRLTTRGAIRSYFDEQGFHNPGLITDELVEYVYTSAHQPNARYAAGGFLGNALSMNVEEPLARLQAPVLIVIGREGNLTPAEASDAFKRANSKVEVRILDRCNTQPQDEQATLFNSMLKELVGANVK